jgi:hypothetical protein
MALKFQCDYDDDDELNNTLHILIVLLKEKINGSKIEIKGRLKT